MNSIGRFEHFNAKSNYFQPDSASYSREYTINNMVIRKAKVGAILSGLMKDAGISESALSRSTGVPQTTINRIINGVTNDPRERVLAPIAKHFGITVPMLRGQVPMQGDGTIRPLSSQEDNLLKLFGRLISSQKEYIFKRLEELVSENESIYDLIDIHRKLQINKKLQP